MTDAAMYIDALIGRGFPSYAFYTKMEAQGLAFFLRQPGKSPISQWHIQALQTLALEDLQRLYAEARAA